MAIKNKQCLCCSNKFSYCPDCSKADALKPSWASTFCSEDCMTIWTTATKYNLNKITKSEAKSIISKLTLKPTEQYVTCVQRDLGVILAPESKPKRAKRVEIKPIDDAIPETIIETVKDIILNEESHEVVNKTEE